MRRSHFSPRLWILAPALLGLVVAAGAVSLDLTLQAPTNLQAYFLQDLNLSGQGLSQEVFRAVVASDLPPTQVSFAFSLNCPVSACAAS